jgi:hypothetical protein
MLRSPLSVLGATLASFLVVLALLTAKVTSGQEQALPAGGGGTALVVKNGQKVLRTTASGRVIEPASGAAGVQAGNAQGGARQAALVTHTSGALGGGGQDD